jgi:hypothetical protein
MQPTDLLRQSLHLQLLRLRLAGQPDQLGRRGVEPVIPRQTTQVRALASRLYVAHQLPQSRIGCCGSRHAAGGLRHGAYFCPAICAEKRTHSHLAGSQRASYCYGTTAATTAATEAPPRRTASLIPLHNLTNPASSSLIPLHNLTNPASSPMHHAASQHHAGVPSSQHSILHPPSHYDNTQQKKSRILE